MNSELHNYFKNYLTDTLGINSIVSDAAIKASSSVKYAIGVEDLKSYNNNESELLNKMIAALKIESTEMELFDLAGLSDRIFSKMTKFILLMNEPRNGNETFSPRVLLVRPDLKRKTWEDLKQFLT